jgi:hypothetical protein
MWWGGPKKRKSFLQDQSYRQIMQYFYNVCLKEGLADTAQKKALDIIQGSVAGSRIELPTSGL